MAALILGNSHMSSVFWWLNLVRLYSVYKILYPKRRIESYSIMGTAERPHLSMPCQVMMYMFSFVTAYRPEQLALSMYFKMYFYHCLRLHMYVL